MFKFVFKDPWAALCFVCFGCYIASPLTKKQKQKNPEGLLIPS